jgi:hypothetical protein
MTRKPFQSKLRPHLEFIRECRAQDMSYPLIAAELRARFDLSAAPSTIFAFVKVRARRRPVFSLPPRESMATPLRAPPAPAPGDAMETGPRAGWLFYDPAKPLVKDTS